MGRNRQKIVWLSHLNISNYVPILFKSVTKILSQKKLREDDLYDKMFVFNVTSYI